MKLTDLPIPPIDTRQADAARAAIATQPDADVLADMLGLTDPAPAPEPRRRALPRHGGGRKQVTL